LNFDNDGNLKSAYFGDLKEKYGFSEEDILKVFELFGVKADQFKARQHYFGDSQGNCNPRPYFYFGH